jgi:hypothetical protein
VLGFCVASRLMRELAGIQPVRNNRSALQDLLPRIVSFVTDAVELNESAEICWRAHKRLRPFVLSSPEPAANLRSNHKRSEKPKPEPRDFA